MGIYDRVQENFVEFFEDLQDYLKHFKNVNVNWFKYCEQNNNCFHNKNKIKTNNKQKQNSKASEEGFACEHLC